MTLHPASLLAVAFDAFALAALTRSLVIAIRIELSWNPASTDHAQLSLERKAEEMSVLARVSMGLFALASFVDLWTVNHALPPLVRGAMCGVGVLQNSPYAMSAIVMRVAAAMAFAVLFRLDQTNRSSPTGLLTATTAKAVLVSAPVVAVSFWQSTRALLTVDTQRSVSCCAAVYDLGRSSHTAPWLSGYQPWMLPALGLSSAALVTCSFISRKRKKAALALLVLAGIFSWIGLRVLVDFASPYIYGLLAHHCPLCLFLPRYWAIGYVQYGALMLVILQSLSLVVYSRLLASDDIDAGVSARRKACALGVIVAVVLFIAATFAPVVAWRLRFDAWL